MTLELFAYAVWPLLMVAVVAGVAIVLKRRGIV